MRTITIIVDDVGRTEVKFVGIESRFFTKREFDRALRAAKLQYRLLKREYRRSQIIERANVTIGEKDEATRRQPRPEPRPEQKASDQRKREVPRRAAGSLQDALRAKSERNRRAKAGN